MSGPPLRPSDRPIWPRHCYTTLAQRWLNIFDPDPDDIFDVLNAYRGVANAKDVLCRPKTDHGEGWNISDDALSVWDPYKDRIWQVTGYDMDNFIVDAMNLHGSKRP